MAMIQTLVKTEPSVIDVGGTTQITTELTAIPGLLNPPSDIVLVLEQSAALTADQFARMKAGAKDMVKQIVQASGGTEGTTLGTGVRMGMAGYSSTASLGIGLTADAAGLIRGIDALRQTAKPEVRHAPAMQTGGSMLKGSKGQKILVLFSHCPGTDAPEAAVTAAQALKGQGIRLFALGPDSRTAELTAWADSPAGFYACLSGPKEPLEAAFALAAEHICRKDSKSVVLDIKMEPDFEITRVISCTQGHAAVQGNTAFLKWLGEDLGMTGQQTSSMTYEVRHVGTEKGLRNLNQQSRLTDVYRQVILMDSAQVTVGTGGGGGGGEVVPEGGGKSADFQVEGCRDMVQVEIPDVTLQALGRVVELNVILKAVCPGKRVAVTVLLAEISTDKQEQVRGVKHFLIPAHSGPECRDVTLSCIQFSLPEALDVSGSPDSICNPRNLRARVIANYVDSEVVPCGDAAVTL